MPEKYFLNFLDVLLAELQIRTVLHFMGYRVYFRFYKRNLVFCKKDSAYQPTKTALFYYYRLSK